MKKYLFFTIIFLLMGCRSQNISIENPISISYNDYTIIENDYDTITNLLSQLKFSCGKKQNYNTNLLTITDQNTIYHFHISHNYYMEFQENNKYCYTKDSQQVENLVNELNNLIKKYQNTNFLTLNSSTSYESNDDDTYIKLDKVNQYITLSSELPIYNLKINEIEYDKEELSYKEINLLYSIESIEANKKIVIRKNVVDEATFKISFETPYNYQVNIIPVLNAQQEIRFQTEINQK